ncbi:MAG: hypothetical protein ACI9LM_000124 [Alteromonadaceae bacterium]|jgi:hypothetical protein
MYSVYSELLVEIGSLVVAANFLVLLAALIARVSDKSILISLTVLCVLNGMMQWLAFYLESKFGVWDKVLMRHTYYLSFAALEGAGVYLLLNMHKALKTAPSTTAKAVSFAFAVHATILLVKYYVRMHLSSNPDLNFTDFEVIVEFIYKHAIPTINISTVIITIYLTIKAWLNQKEGVRNA